MNCLFVNKKTIKDPDVKNKGGESMTASFKEESENFFVITFEGALTFSDLKEIERKADSAVVPGRKIKVLFLAENFSGLASEGDWSDISFRVAHEHYIEKIAVVSTKNKKWKETLFNFLEADMRRAPVKFFPAGKEAKAREWLQKGNQTHGNP